MYCRINLSAATLTRSSATTAMENGAVLAQFCRNLTLGSRPMLVRASLETMLFSDEVSCCLHQTIAFFRGWFRYRFLSGGWLGLGVWSFRLRSFRRRSFLFHNGGCHFFHCGCFGLFQF